MKSRIDVVSLYHINLTLVWPRDFPHSSVLAADHRRNCIPIVDFHLAQGCCKRVVPICKNLRSVAERQSCELHCMFHSILAIAVALTARSLHSYRHSQAKYCVRALTIVVQIPCVSCWQSVAQELHCK